MGALTLPGPQGNVNKQKVRPTDTSVSRSVADIFGDFVSAANWGLSTTASAAVNTAAIVSALASGKRVRLPAGTFNVNGNAIELKVPGQHLQGEGISRTILKLADSPLIEQGPVIRIAKYQQSNVRGTVERCSLSDLEIDGNKANQPNGSEAIGSGSGVALIIEDAKDAYVRNVYVHDCDGYGVGITGSHLPHRGDIYLDNVISRNNSYDGFDIKAGLQSCRMVNCRSEDNGSADSAIEDRDAVGFDMRGDDIQLLGCVSINNASGNFRVRENCGRMGRLIGCISRNAPDGVFGFHLIGGGVGLYTLISCHSFNDSTGFRWRSGHHKLLGCSANQATNYGFHLDDDGPSTYTTTSSAVPIETGMLRSFTATSSTNLSPGMFIRIIDGARYVEGPITDISGSIVTFDAQSNLGAAGDLAVGSIVQLRIRGSFTAIGCHITRSGVDNVTALNTDLFVRFVDCEMQFAERYGINCVNLSIEMIRCDVRNNLRGVNLQTMATRKLVVESCTLTDDRTDKMQTYAFQWGASGNQGCTGRIVNCDLSGNVTGVHSGTVPTGIEIRDVSGANYARKGTTANRPTVLNADADVGFEFFDTTLGYPVFWKGTGWVTGAGAAA